MALALAMAAIGAAGAAAGVAGMGRARDPVSLWLWFGVVAVCAPLCGVGLALSVGRWP